MANGDRKEHDWIQTYVGDKFFLAHPTPDQIHASDIAHSLAHQTRYLGHAKQFYSIAEHCTLMASYEWERAEDPDMALWALLHDATEAYIPDFPRPWKRLPQFEFVREAEEELMAVIAKRFELPGTSIPDHIDALDRRILCDEAQQIFKSGPTDNWHKRWEPGLGITVTFRSPEEAEAEYFAMLTGLLQIRIEQERVKQEG